MPNDLSSFSWIEIDLRQFRQNLRAIRKRLEARCRLCLAVKANAYGHGLIPMAREAESSGIVDILGVSCLKEGVELRKAGIQIPILMMGSIQKGEVAAFVQHQIQFSVSSFYKARFVSEESRALSQRPKVHIEVDTGMRRTGARKEGALEIFRYLKNCPEVDITGIFSHFATADDSSDPIAQQQLSLFQELLADPLIQEGSLVRHMANSKGFLFFPSSHFDMVRLGILPYGYLPSQVFWPEIRPCFSVKSKVSYFKVLYPGEALGYGHTYRPQQKTRIVTVPIGYGDGYLRALSGRAHVLIRGRRYPVVGAICMDQLMVDLGEGTAYVGDEVVLIGKQGEEQITAEELAGCCGSIVYEVLCLFTQRVSRFYQNASSAGIEPTTCCLGGDRSIH